MIFVTVGNWAKGFDRLVRAVDKLKGDGIVAEDVFAQIGDGRYVPDNLQFVKYCSPGQFDSYVQDATMVISHAGMGTIAKAMMNSKPIIVVPRKSSLGEHVDDHQFATVEALEQEGKILVAYEVSQLQGKLEQARSFIPAKGQGNDKILEAVGAFVEDLAARKRRRAR